MGAVKVRHVIGAVLGALAAFLVIVAFLALYSVMNGSAPLKPFENAKAIGPFTGTLATGVLVFLDFLIPLVAGLVYLVALALISRTSLSGLALTSSLRAVGHGLLLGLAVFVSFYIPVMYTLSHPTLAQAVKPLLQGFADHLAFGVALVLVIYGVGGPVAARLPRGIHLSPADAAAAETSPRSRPPGDWT